MSDDTGVGSVPPVSRRELVQRLFGLGATALATALGAGASVVSLTTAPPARAAVPEGGLPTKRKFRYGMVIDTRRCVGCRACVVACKAENKTPPGVSYTVVVEEAVANRFDDKPIFMTKPCFHCENPPCVDVCPVSATFKRERDGIVVIDYDRCIGCRYCITGCPYGARYFDFGENYAPIAAGTPYAQVPSPEYGQFRVRADGSPVGNAYVRLLHRTGEFTAEVPTSATGHFRFFAGDGEWTLRTLAPKADPVDKKVVAATGSIAEVLVAI